MQSLVLVAENPYEAQMMFNYVSLLIKSKKDSQLHSQLDSQLGKYHNEYLFTLNVYSDCYYNWFEFVRKELGIKLDKETNNIFQKTFKLQKESGIYNAIFSEALCVISKYPKKVHRNESFDLHNVNGSAVEWSSFSNETSFYCFYVNGRQVEKSLIESEFSKNDVIQENNEDVKAAMISIIKEREGDQGLLSFLDAVIVDEQEITHFEGYIEKIRLYKTKESYDILQDRHGVMGQPYCWSEIKCPSTGSTYLIENSADFTDALEAVKFLRPSFIPQELAYQWAEFAN